MEHILDFQILLVFFIFYFTCSIIAFLFLKITTGKFFDKIPTPVVVRVCLLGIFIVPTILFKLIKNAFKK